MSSQSTNIKQSCEDKVPDYLMQYKLLIKITFIVIFVSTNLDSFQKMSWSCIQFMSF